MRRWGGREGERERREGDREEREGGGREERERERGGGGHTSLEHTQARPQKQPKN